MKSPGHRTALFEELTGLTRLKALLVALPALALIGFSVWAAVQFLDPMPPRRIVLATGPEGSALHELGKRYARSVEKAGISVELRFTRGAADNLALLAAPDGEVAAGFVIAGMAEPDEARRLVNVSNLAHVPLWCLARAPQGDITLAELKGKRLAVGAPGSGLNSWLAPLLAANGITAQNTQLMAITPEESVRALSLGQADAIFLGEGAEGPHFDEALDIPGAHLMSFPRAEAYTRRFPHFVALHLPAGTLDLARGIPERPLNLIGATVMLAARADVHPTVVDLLVDAARQQSQQGVFEKRGEFPNLDPVDLIPVSEQALHYVRDGPSLLRRYLPLWAADAIQRTIVLAVPLLAVLLPIVRYLPSIFDLLGRRRMLLGYAALRRVDRALRARRPDEPVNDLLLELDHVEENVASIRESVLKAGELYTLRVHLRVVRDAVLSRAAKVRRASASAAAPVE